MPRIAFALFASLLILLFSAVVCTPSVAEKAGTADKASALLNANAEVFRTALETVYARNLLFTKPGVSAREFDFFDFDHTLADTDTMVPVKAQSGVERMEDSKCFHLEKGETANYEVFTRQELYGAPPIPESIKRAREYSSAADTQVAVITARGQAHTFNSIFEYTAQRGAEVDIVLPIHTDLIQKALWDKLTIPRGMDKVPSEMKKALLMAALIDLTLMRGGSIRTARYFEDTDSYFRGAMEFLPARYPDIHWEFYDYVRSGTEKHRTYTERQAASADKGQIHQPDGGALTPASYSSGDCPGL